MSDETPRLSLVAPPLTDIAAAAARLEAALGAGDVASLLLRPPAADPAQAEMLLAQLVGQAQAHGVAAIIEESGDLALATGADGVEIKGAGAPLSAAIKRFSPQYIVGAAALPTRHAAMEAGEAGADYVVFADDLPMEEALERLRWWAEVFTTPCVACAGRLADVGPLAEAGADFVLLGECVWDDPRGPAAAVAEALAALAAAGAARAAAAK